MKWNVKNKLTIFKLRRLPELWFGSWVFPFKKLLFSVRLFLFSVIMCQIFVENFSSLFLCLNTAASSRIWPLNFNKEVEVDEELVDKHLFWRKTLLHIVSIHVKVSWSMTQCELSAIVEMLQPPSRQKGPPKRPFFRDDAITFQVCTIIAIYL